MFDMSGEHLWGVPRRFALGMGCPRCRSKWNMQEEGSTMATGCCWDAVGWELRDINRVRVWMPLHWLFLRWQHLTSRYHRRWTVGELHCFPKRWLSQVKETANLARMTYTWVKIVGDTLKLPSMNRRSPLERVCIPLRKMLLVLARGTSSRPSSGFLWSRSMRYPRDPPVVGTFTKRCLLSWTIKICFLFVSYAGLFLTYPTFWGPTPVYINIS